MRRFIAFDGILPDSVVAECLDPFIPVEIERNDRSGWVTYYSEDWNVSDLRKRLDARVPEFEAVLQFDRIKMKFRQFVIHRFQVEYQLCRDTLVRMGTRQGKPRVDEKYVDVKHLFAYYWS